MKRYILILTLFLGTSAFPSMSNAGMGADEFVRYTRGKTLFFGNDGEPYGVERYLDGRRVIWSFLDGDCKNGT